MSSQDIRGLETIDALNVIRQKHVKDLDAEDIAFLRAHEERLSELDRNIYLKGMSPKKASEQATVFNSRNDRIIHENRPLQDIQAAQFAAKNATVAAVEVKEDEIDKKWTERISSLNKEADYKEKNAESSKAEAAVSNAQAKMDADAASARPVYIVEKPDEVAEAKKANAASKSSKSTKADKSDATNKSSNSKSESKKKGY